MNKSILISLIACLSLASVENNANALHKQVVATLTPLGEAIDCRSLLNEVDVPAELTYAELSVEERLSVDQMESNFQKGNASEVLKNIRNNPALLNAKDKLGWTALMYAATNNNMNALYLLLSAGATINVRASNGTVYKNATALILCLIRQNCEEAALALLNNGANTSLRYMGKDALQIAIENNQPQSVIDAINGNMHEAH